MNEEEKVKGAEDKNEGEVEGLLAGEVEKKKEA